MDAPSRLRLLVPNLVTSANITAGFLAILVAADGRFELAVYLLVLAILLDLCDGQLARRLHATSRFGQEMDSFSDAISFCLAPALLIYFALLRDLELLGLLVALSFVLAGVFRLARFNLTSDVHAKARYTTGVPTPVGAGYLMVTVLMREVLPAGAAVVLVLVMAVLMVSRVHLPDFRGRGPVAMAMLVGILNYLAIVVWPNWLTVVWWNVWNVVILLLAHAENRHLKLVTEE